MARPFNPDLIPEMEAPRPYTVTELNALARKALERNFNSIYLVGEVSNLSRQPSGHVYFTLKDTQSQIDAVLWRDYAEALLFTLEPGMEVLAFGDVTLYTKMGRYQISVRTLEPRGAGALDLAFRQLTAKLEAEGLFAPEHKKELPFIPRRIALVTSISGDAVHDMLKSIYSRCANARVSVLPVQVQGAGASKDIAAAIKTLNADGGFDVIVVGRGGGSQEDLWAFNEEPLARAIYASRIPIVSAVGHEKDVTISDLVADARAMTPTQVGQLIVPDECEIRQRLDDARSRLIAALSRCAERATDDLAYAWRHPVFMRPERMIEPLRLRLTDSYDHAARGFDALLRVSSERLQRALVALESLSPLGVLARGYSVTRDAKRNVLKDARSVKPGESIETILHRGRIKSTVTDLEIEEGAPNG